MRRSLTYEKCQEEVSKYNSYTELNQTDPSIIMKIRSKGWFDLLSHWETPHSPKNPKWTYEKCKEEVLKFKYFNDLQGTSVINAIKRNGWWDELTKHLIRQVSEPYTNEEVLTESLKYKTRNDFRINSPGQYGAAKRLGIMDEAVKHMGKSKIVKQYTKEEILESALKYNNQRDWEINDRSVFNTARTYRKLSSSDEDKEFWLSCVSHMDYIFKPNGYWTYDKCKEITKNYTVHSEFYKDYPNIYDVIHKNNWTELLDHIQHITKSGNVRKVFEDFDTIEKCTEESLKYQTRSDMCENSNYAYRIILKNSWDKICFAHMKRQMTLKERVIYVFEFNTTIPKYAYVGLTCQIKRRKNAHLYGTEKGKSPVFEKIKEINVIPEFKLLTSTPIKEEDAPEMEAMWVKEYSDMGYILLNKAKAGSLGAMKSKYTYDYFVKMKEGCENREEYSKKMNSWVRNIAIENGWWEDLISDLVKTKKMPGEWNMENALEEAKNYDCISHLQKSKPGLLKFLDRNNLLKVVFPKTLNELLLEKYNDKEECRKEALKYNYKKDFTVNSRPFYRSAVKNGWIDEICSHMIKPIRTPKPSKWTYELIIEKSSECRNRSEFEIKYSGGYKVAKKYGILNELFPVENRPVRKSIWSYELMKEKSSECKNVSEFRIKYSGAYKVAKKLGYIDEFFPK